MAGYAMPSAFALTLFVLVCYYIPILLYLIALAVICIRQ